MDSTYKWTTLTDTEISVCIVIESLYLLFSDLLVIIAVVLQTAQGGKILKKLTKELKKVSIASNNCFIFTIHIFKNNLFEFIQVLGGSKFEEYVKDNLVSACFDYKLCCQIFSLPKYFLSWILSVLISPSNSNQYIKAQIIQYVSAFCNLKEVVFWGYHLRKSFE